MIRKMWQLLLTEPTAIVKLSVSCNERCGSNREDMERC